MRLETVTSGLVSHCRGFAPPPKVRRKPLEDLEQRCDMVYFSPQVSIF